MTMRRWLLSCALLVGCSSTVEETTTAVQRGEALASDPGFAASQRNAFSCRSCHAIASAGDKILPGAPLGGAAKRPSFWGGRIRDLGDAVDQCAQKFMRAEPIDRKAKKWVDLYAYLQSLAERGPTTAQPFDVVYAITDLPKGSADAGRDLWARSCQSCHGAAETGAGRPRAPDGTTPSPIVPNETEFEHGSEGVALVRQVIIEKVRHGSYLGFPGVMPPFSREALSDAQIADVLTYLGQHP